MKKSKWTYQVAPGDGFPYPFKRAYGARNRTLATRKGDVVLTITGWVADAEKLGNDDHFLLVLRRSSDGSWKVVMDCVNW